MCEAGSLKILQSLLGENAPFLYLQNNPPSPPPLLSIFSPDFPKTLDTNDKTGFEKLRESEEGCETPSPPNAVLKCADTTIA